MTDTATIQPDAAVTPPRSRRGLADVLTRPIHWFTGPILTKELRVASRRKRLYALRLAYLAVMTMILVPIWFEAMDRNEFVSRGYYSSRVEDSATNAAYRMADIGRTLVPAIVWIQFAAVQLVAMLSMSTSISDEITRRTLGTLLTTPINAWQLVMGKLASCLVQCVGLLAMSLPVLMLLTVFGGVEWSFVLIGLALTLSSLLIVSSVTMYFSVHNRRPYVAFLESLLALGILLGGSILVAMLILHDSYNPAVERIVLGVLTAFHPVMTLMGVQNMGSLGTSGVPWWVCVAVNVAFSALVLSRCVRVVRKASLASAMGMTLSELRQQEKTAQVTTLAPVMMSPSAARSTGVVTRSTGVPPVSRMGVSPMQTLSIDQTSLSQPTANEMATPCAEHGRDAHATHGRDARATGKDARATMRSLRGNPVYWKDSIRRRFRTRTDIAAVIVLGIQFVSYFAALSLSVHYIEAIYQFSLGILGSLIAIVVAATVIPGEREARTWDMVLASPMSNDRIVWGKFLAALRRFALAFFPLGLHVLIFTFGMMLHPLSALLVAAVTIGMASFIAAMGVLVGTFARRTTTTLVAVLVICLLLWLVTPLVPFLAEHVKPDPYGYHDRTVSEAVLNVNPFMQLIVIGNAMSHISSDSTYQYLWYNWPDESRGFGDTTMIILFTTGGYVLAAAVALGIASSRLRKIKE